MPRSYTLIHTFAPLQKASADVSEIAGNSPALPHVGPSVWLFCFVFLVICLISGLGFSRQGCTQEEGSYDVFPSSDTVCPEQCVLQKNKYESMRRLCSQPSACVCICVCVFWCAVCFLFLDQAQAPAPLSLCVFVCADLFQQFSFGRALGASSLSAPV